MHIHKRARRHEWASSPRRPDIGQARSPGEQRVPRRRMVAAKSARCAALVGPYLSGKTTLLESILFATQRVPRKGNIKDKNTVGDASPEARARGMSTETNIASTEFLGDPWSFIDCPGSIEFQQEARNA